MKNIEKFIDLFINPIKDSITTNNDIPEYLKSEILPMTSSELKTFLLSEWYDMEPKNLTEREMQELTYLKDIRNEDTLRYSVLSNKWNSETSISLKEPYNSLDKTQTYSVKRLLK